MNKRKPSKVSIKPYFHNENIVVFYEMQHGRDTIVKGDKIAFKNTRGKFVFMKMVENRDTLVSWIDCIEEKTLNYRSFYTDKLKGKIKPRRPRKRRIVSE